MERRVSRRPVGLAIPRRLRPWLLAGGAVLAVVVVFALGRATAPGEQVDVEIQARYGDPSLGAGEEALIVIAGGLLESVVERSLADAPGAVEFDDVVAELTADGLAVSADAGVRILGVPVRAGISTVALP